MTFPLTFKVSIGSANIFGNRFIKSNKSIFIITKILYFFDQFIRQFFRNDKESSFRLRFFSRSYLFLFSLPPLSLSYLQAFALIAFSFILYYIPSVILISIFSLCLTRFLPHAFPFSPIFLSFVRSLSLSLSVLLSFFFILETIQIPSVMLELQKPGQSAATSEAPGIAARYDSANTITTRPLHESNS